MSKLLFLAKSGTRVDSIQASIRSHGNSPVMDERAGNFQAVFQIPYSRSSSSCSENIDNLGCHNIKKRKLGILRNPMKLSPCEDEWMCLTISVSRMSLA